MQQASIGWLGPCCTAVCGSVCASQGSAQDWLQGCDVSGSINVREVSQEQNTADAVTKEWTVDAAKHFTDVWLEGS